MSHISRSLLEPRRLAFPGPLPAVRPPFDGPWSGGMVAAFDPTPWAPPFPSSWPRPQAGRRPDPVGPIAGWPAAAKRGMDVVLAALLLVVLAVPMAGIALWIRLDSTGPALFRQRRIGLGGRGFVLLKFRTMRPHATDPGRCPQATRRDARVTRAGARLRRWSIDESPQLINVLRGEMSLVGPRPHAPGTCAGGRPFEQVAADYAARHLVRPGMTGLAQVRGWRGETETEDKLRRRVEADLEYIARWSLGLDLWILLRTVPALLRPTNAW